MILTGTEISSRVNSGDITITPFIKENINPNSYNFRLDRKLLVYKDDILDVKKTNHTEEIYIENDGFNLKKGQLYLASTIEKMGSNKFVPTYAARSSIARLGLFINLSAPLGDIGFCGNWTIQLFPTKNLRVYYGMKIGQIMFWHVNGMINLYQGKYQGANGPISSQIYKDYYKQRNNQTKIEPYEIEHEVEVA